MTPTWTWLLIGFVIALAVAPLTHFFPSKRQRTIANLREVAATNGLFVEFRSAPSYAPLNPDARAARRSEQVIFYGKRLPHRLTAKPKKATFLLEKQGWRSLGGYVPVPLILQELPPGVLAASIDADTCGVYWNEQGDAATVLTIRSVLEHWIVELAE